MTEKRKKIILWSITLVLAVVLFFWWINNAQKMFASFRGAEFIQRLNFPKIETPKTEIPKEELGNKFKELEEIIKNAEEISTTTQ